MSMARHKKEALNDGNDQCDDEGDRRCLTTLLAMV